MLNEEPKEALKESLSRQIGALAGQPQYNTSVALSRAPKITFVEVALAESRSEQTPLATTAVATSFESTRETLSSATAARNTTLEDCWPTAQMRKNYEHKEHKHCRHRSADYIKERYQSVSLRSAMVYIDNS